MKAQNEVGKQFLTTLFKNSKEPASDELVIELEIKDNIFSS